MEYSNSEARLLDVIHNLTEVLKQKTSVITTEDQLRCLQREFEKLKIENVRLRNGRDERQKERDKEREKVRILKAELEQNSRSATTDDVNEDLQRATVGEFRRLEEKEKKADLLALGVQSVLMRNIKPEDKLHKIANLVYCYRVDTGDIKDELPNLANG